MTPEAEAVAELVRIGWTEDEVRERWPWLEEGDVLDGVATGRAGAFVDSYGCWKDWPIMLPGTSFLTEAQP